MVTVQLAVQLPALPAVAAGVMGVGAIAIPAAIVVVMEQVHIHRPILYQKVAVVVAEEEALDPDGRELARL
jgi:hypothetical protein